ncbi:MAG: HAD family phosphatase [Nocardioidaceae bacterium]|nr:HAD family phosphatase [Nocardioidaceae bacterium]
MSKTPSCHRNRLVVFDCDGVLVDSERLAVDLDVRVLGALGWEITREEVIERFVGRSDADMRAEIEEHLGRALPGNWDAGWADEYRRVLDERLVSVPGVVEAIAEVVAQGFATCVASSGSHAKMQNTLALTGLSACFEGRIFSATEVPRGKPAPDLFLYAASTMGFDPSSCVVVEDSRYGVEAARAAGMAVIGYAGGITPRTHLEDADIVITNMGELAASIQQLSN